MINSNLLCTPCCHSQIVYIGNLISCQRCGANYLLLANDLPLFVPFPERYFSQTAIFLERERLKKIEKLIQLKNFLESSTKNKPHLVNLQQAYEHNLDLLSSFITPIKGSHSTLEVEKLSARYLHFDTCLKYLERDWSDGIGAQEEVKTVEDRVIQLVQKYNISRESALFLGAGLGRFAYDLSSLFERSIAIDNSILMGLLYKQVLQSDINFYRISLRNAPGNHNQYKSIDASLKHSPFKPTPKQLPQYAIANGNYLPLANKSISTILSIYFTDVLPMSRLWPEILRVLQPGGVFIHYGPLEYHFNSLHESYSAIALKAYIEDHGFQIMDDEQWNEHPHLTHTSNNFLLYNNWSFAAIRNA